VCILIILGAELAVYLATTEYVSENCLFQQDMTVPHIERVVSAWPVDKFGDEMMLSKMETKYPLFRRALDIFLSN